MFIALRAEVLTISVSGGVFRVVSSDLLDVNIPERSAIADEGTDIESSGVASGQAAIADPQGIFDDIGKDLCKIGCDTAAAAATAACIAAAAAAREVCRDNC